MNLRSNLVIFCVIFIIVLGYGNAIAADRISLSVLNFYCDNSSGLGMGFSETLINKLNKLPNLNVMQKESQRPLLQEMGLKADQKFDPSMGQTIGKNLGVDYIIGGNLKEDGNTVKVKYQLFNVKKGTVVAEESLKGEKEKIFDIQAELGMKVAKNFNTEVSSEIKKELYFMPTQNISSFDKFSAGLKLYEESRIDEAYNFFLSSIKLDTAFLDAHRYYEYTARKTGKLNDFINNYETMLKKEPKNPILMNYLGNAYFDKGNYVKAESLYKNAIQLAPNFSNPHNNLAAIYSLNQKYQEAIGEFEKALKYTDRKAPVYGNMGLCYLNMGEKEKAKEYFKKALDMDPKNPDFAIARQVLYGVKVLVTSKEKKVPGYVFGEILMNSEPVFDIQTASGGFTPADRAKIIAGRLQVMIADGLKPYDITIGKLNNQVIIQTTGGQLIMTIGKDMAAREGTTPEKLAQSKSKVLKEILNTATTVSYSTGGFSLQAGLFKVTEENIKLLEGKIPADKLTALSGLGGKFYDETTLKAKLEGLKFTNEEIDTVKSYIMVPYKITTEDIIILGASINNEKLTSLNGLKDKTFEQWDELEVELKQLGFTKDESKQIQDQLDRVETYYVFTEEMINKVDTTIGSEKVSSLQSIKNSKFTDRTLAKKLEELSFTGDEITGIFKALNSKEMEGATKEATYLHRGDKYYSEGDLDKAADEYQKALQTNPSFSPAQVCLGVISYDKKDYNGAVSYLNGAIKTSPDYFDAYKWLGKTYMVQGKKTEAKDVFTKALKIDPNNAEVKTYLKQL